MSDTPICTGACIFGKCPNKTCVKYSQGAVHRAVKAEMSILTSGNLPKGPTGKSGYGIAVDIGTTTVAAYLYDFDKGECAAVERHLQFARDLHIDTRMVEGDRQAETLVEFARLQKATQIFIARPHYSFWQRLVSTNLVHQIVRLAPDMRLTIVSEHRAG
jgi:hypothetical protein